MAAWLHPVPSPSLVPLLPGMNRSQTHQKGPGPRPPQGSPRERRSKNGETHAAVPRLSPLRQGVLGTKGGFTAGGRGLCTAVPSLHPDASSPPKIFVCFAVGGDCAVASLAVWPCPGPFCDGSVARRLRDLLLALDRFRGRCNHLLDESVHRHRLRTLVAHRAPRASHPDANSGDWHTKRGKDSKRPPLNESARPVALPFVLTWLSWRPLDGDRVTHFCPLHASINPREYVPQNGPPV